MANNNLQRSQVVLKFILMEKFQKWITDFNFYNIMYIWFCLPGIQNHVNFM